MRDFRMCRICFRKLALQGDIPGVIISNKSDLPPSPESKMVKRVAKDLNLPMFVTSAKTGANVESAFEAAGRAIIERRNQPR